MSVLPARIMTEGMINAFNSMFERPQTASLTPSLLNIRPAKYESAAATSVAKNIFQWQIGLVGRNTGNSLVQEKINYGMQIAGQIGSSAGMFGLGLALGNPLMMLAGVTSGINSLISYVQEREQFNYDRTWESRELVYARERAGMSYNRSRTE